MKRHTTLFLAFCTVLSVYAGQSSKPKLPDGKNSVQLPVSRDVTTAKIDGDLQALIRSFGPRARGNGGPQVNIKDDLARIYGFEVTDTNPVISVYCEGKNITGADVKSVGGELFSRMSQGVIVKIALNRVSGLAKLGNISNLSPMKAKFVPTPAGRKKAPQARGAMTTGEVGMTWDKQGMTGKGTIVCIMDTGIAYQHPDFLKPDGTSRLRYLYDMSDDSFEKSGGKVGSAPPLKSAAGKPLGTLYTREQLNAALKGKGTCNSVDKVGHGTACTSTAAGSGNYAPAAGVAPEADLIFVKAMIKRNGSEVFSPDYPAAAQWVVAEAKKAKMPVSISMSFGSQFNGHNGKDADEKVLDTIVGDVPGVSICVSAGNEGREAFHASGAFGPKKVGQMDVEGEPIEAFVNDPLGSTLLTFFKATDDWGFMVIPRQPIFTNKEGNDVPGVKFSVYRTPDKKFSVSATVPAGQKLPEGVLQQALALVNISPNMDGEDRLQLELPFGSYDIYGFGNTENVKDGTFDVYGPDYSAVSFGKGSSDEYMIGSPGNASNVITVGAYVNRNIWKSDAGQNVAFNLLLGSTTNFSSPGPRRDGLTKPEISAPGQYVISAMAPGSEMSKDSAEFVQGGGKYLAWMGTSASSPYCAGVIALMMQKNSNLTTNQIRKILMESATVDKLTRGVPNPYYGNGKLNPEKALKNTKTIFESLQIK